MEINKKNKIAVVYRDVRGYVIVYVDDYGVSFSDGKAYFSNGENDYVIGVECLVSVG